MITAMIITALALLAIAIYCMLAMAAKNPPHHTKPISEAESLSLRTRYAPLWFEDTDTTDPATYHHDPQAVHSYNVRKTPD
jgi:hypothetical protein